MARIFAIACVFIASSIAWAILGGVTHGRTTDQKHGLRGQVVELWGRPHNQSAPSFTFERPIEKTIKRTEKDGDKTREVTQRVWETETTPRMAASTNIEVDLRLDQRRKGLMWYPLYDVMFDGAWRYKHDLDHVGTLRIGFAFPDSEALYDGFVFRVNKRDLARELKPENGKVQATVEVKPGDEVTIAIAYKSRGMETWRYDPAQGLGNIEKFTLKMRTDFSEIDFPSRSLSPSARQRNGEGWELTWAFAQVVTGHDIGMAMPALIQPGELAAALSWSAPVSLLFFFLLVFVLATLRGIDIHPINYVFIAAAFFAFHLLFAYSADHLDVKTAFAVAAVTSMVLVVSYLRLVVSARFALVEAALGQLVYLVGFSVAHFWDGFTGLTVTVLSIATLFLLMQMTGRVKWSEVLGRRKAQPAMGPPIGAPATQGVSLT